MNFIEPMRRLQVRYNNIKHYLQQYLPTRDVMRNLHEIQQELQAECKTLQNATWDNLIEKLDVEKSPKTFWEGVNKLMGSKNKPRTQIKDQNGNKLYSEQEIEQAFRRQWNKVFKISEQENEEFDEEIVRTEMEQQILGTSHKRKVIRFF